MSSPGDEAVSPRIARRRRRTGPPAVGSPRRPNLRPCGLIGGGGCRIGAGVRGQRNAISGLPGPEQFGVFGGRAACGGSEAAATGRPLPGLFGFASGEPCRPGGDGRGAGPEINPRASESPPRLWKRTYRPENPRLGGAGAPRPNPSGSAVAQPKGGTRMPSPRSSKCASSVRHRPSTRWFGTIWPCSLGGPRASGAAKAP